MIGMNVTLAGNSAPCLGRIAIDQVRDRRILGTFTPGPDFAAIEPLVREYEEIINDQIFSLLDEFAAKFEQLGLHLISADGQLIGPVDDLQIASDGGTLVQLGASAAPPNGAAGRAITSRVS
jgi:hypothetical protein